MEESTTVDFDTPSSSTIAVYHQVMLFHELKHSDIFWSSKIQVGILRDHHDSEIFTIFGSQVDLNYKNLSNGSKTILNRLL